MNIVIIPARSKSKRIRNKNIINFFNKPIIYYTLRCLRKSKLFKKIIVSTDNNKIGNIAKKYGADIILKRSKYLSNDKAASIAVIKDAVRRLKRKKLKFNYVCMAYATAPNIKISNLKKGLKLIKNKNYDFIFLASEKHYISKKVFTVNNNLEVIRKTEKKNSIIRYFKDAGQFYWAKKEVWLKKKSVFTDKSRIIKIPDTENHDLNTHKEFSRLKKFFKKHFYSYIE